MTKLAVYNPTSPAPVEEKTVYLSLQQNIGHVLLKALNEKGGHEPCGNLMKFYPDGTFIVIESGEINRKDFKSRF